MKLQKYYVIFVYILQGKMGKMGKMENNGKKIMQNTENQKRKIWEYETKQNQKSILHLYWKINQIP